LGIADAIPDEIVTAAPRSQVVVQTGDGIADNLLLLGQEKRKTGENALARLGFKIGFVRRTAPYVISRIDRLYCGATCARTLERIPMATPAPPA
jgi:hypothetical protein